LKDGDIVFLPSVASQLGPLMSRIKTRLNKFLHIYVISM